LSAKNLIADTLFVKTEMDTTHADAQAALPTDMVESTDLHVDVVSINGTKLMV
jgi:hypothetical protein